MGDARPVRAAAVVFVALVAVEHVYFAVACVVVAGVFGGATVNKRIFFVQAALAAIGLALVLLS